VGLPSFPELDGEVGRAAILVRERLGTLDL